ncbi:uncharacterized protein [Alexandromys fortis]|uniref:uncharacterized protein n=1 Tax=Alexandromys fortis TaxID=100897 RepID=UPI002152CFE4|nr:uncharacterized protein LOC126490044 [Microtus fortis]
MARNRVQTRRQGSAGEQGGWGDAKRRKSSQLAEPALPSQAHPGGKAGRLGAPSRARKLCAPAHRAGERAHARALRPRPPAGRGKTRPRSWRGPGSASASSHARRCCGSAGHVTARPPLRRAVPPHRDSALCAGCSPSGSGPERRLSRTHRKVVVVAAVSETQVRTARRSSGVTRLRFLVGGFAEILGGERRRCALGTRAPLGLSRCLMASSGF